MGEAQVTGKEAASTSPALNLFPLKLSFVNLSSLSFEAREIPDNLPLEKRAEATPGHLRVSLTANVGDDKAVVVATLACLFSQSPPETGDAKGEVASDPSTDYYSLAVGVTAGFLFDQKEMSKNEVQEWCQKGSFFILLPYIRSIISWVTLESGFPAIKLPLLQVPTFRPPVKKVPSDKKDPQPKG